MLSKTTYLLISFFFLSESYILSQQPGEQYTFKHLTIENGLAQNIAYHFLQDSYGYVWIGTQNGLTMFDGTNAITFKHDEQKSNSIASNFITRIVEDADHQVWIGNEKGIDLFNRRDNTFSHYGVSRSNGVMDNTYSVVLGFVLPTELWFIDTKTKSIRAFNTKTKTSQFICDMNEVDGRIYIDSATNIIHFWSGQSIGTVHLTFKKHTLLSKQTFFAGNTGYKNSPLQVVHVLQQNDSTAWLSTNDGLFCLNARNNTYKVYDHWNNQSVFELRFSALSHNGILWIGTGPSGIFTFDINKREFTGNYKNDRLDPFTICSNNIVSLYFDKSGNVWCGSYGNGASYANIENIFFTKHFINNNESSNNFLWTALDDKQNCWCIIDDQYGFWVFDKAFKNIRHLTPVLKNEKRFIGSIYKVAFHENEHVWCATNKGLYLYNAYSNIMQQIKYPLLSEANFGSSWIMDILKLRDGSFIFSTFAGLYNIKNNNKQTEIKLYSSLNEIYDKSFHALFQDEDENIYVRGDDSLFILKPNANDNQPSLVKSIAFPVDIYQYFSDSVRRLIYLATSDGLYVLNKKNYTIQKHFFLQPVPFQTVSNVFEKDGKLWLFGEKGLYYFDEKNKQGRTFTVEDGLPSNEFNESSISFSPGEKCIAGTTKGLISFHPDKFLKNLYPPRAQLNHIYINDTLFNSTITANETSNIQLSYRKNTFAFDFSAIAFQHNKECSYQYKLEGYDDGWIKSGPSHYTRYSKIPPGQYTFKLRVYDINGVLSPFSKELQIDISKAFWQTTLFQLAALVVVLIIAWMLVKWSLVAKMKKQKIVFDKQQAVEQERTRIAMEMHDDLGSGLTAIRYMAGSLAMQSSSEMHDKANKIASSAKSLVDSMNDIIWTIKSDNNSLAETLAYIKKQAAEQLEIAGINSKFDFDKNIPGIKLTSEQKRNLLLISKEATHNIIKHSGATEVMIIAQVTDNFLELKISDNGKGIEPEKISQFGNGLKSMDRRAKEINAQLNIENDKGTTIIVTLPFG
jgi:signal transduction histidine kinase/ligand-binding sensor domain-containing protein